jgi:hypothetical protein
MINCFQFGFNFAFNFNLSRYSMYATADALVSTDCIDVPADKKDQNGRAVQVDPGLTPA